MNILLAEDDLKLGRLLAHSLKKEFHQVDWVTDGQAAYDYSSSNLYDVIILDWMMPEMTGQEVCSMLRKENCPSSILMLTARDSVDDRVMGLDSGADDYVVKPFEFDELFARIRALARRSIKPLLEETIEVGPLLLIKSAHTLQVNNQPISLTHKEYLLMESLMTNAGHVLTRAQLINKIWGIDAEVFDNNLDVLVKLTRKKMREAHVEQMIKSVRNVGYQIG
ncbi:response regulator transcription factor [Paenisporosarcina antarctica]|uniref:Response regulator transcription factor n=1 Tax=Paenisporosarcina antarctica TaxID=417367 RepID=A0A4P6ZV72_9BACL|nr:response regulator transcription factor [Paenisporosarcina antarctica]QBP40241.1 response regulator transcription factor [Paenisporosarcina antarctica]